MTIRISTFFSYHTGTYCGFCIRLLFQEAEDLLAPVWSVSGESLAADEKLQLTDMFCCSFGNPVRLDFGTGHECSFAIFLFGLFEKKVLKTDEHDPFAVLGIFKGSGFRHSPGSALVIIPTIVQPPICK